MGSCVMYIYLLFAIECELLDFGHAPRELLLLLLERIMTDGKAFAIFRWIKGLVGMKVIPK